MSIKVLFFNPGIVLKLKQNQCNIFMSSVCFHASKSSSSMSAAVSSKSWCDLSNKRQASTTLYTFAVELSLMQSAETLQSFNVCDSMAEFIDFTQLKSSSLFVPNM